ncbi:adenine nucleotide transporter BT1, chloroplastic/mitochondrial isoform X3 [Hevea brasiliensis]|uniref:adenine nucleotide transporter BT1, chloroplastic/mitochondrial isoform X3 n=1 Tax=Hevea brasiliensis TaxID=3981 RepID=UPI0025D41616|nr:adenine nucleotide transporter BT1, chloroplastic/mitochondrial isoform X3 [Hevea brasiliensis]XP_058002065.1 adenine nucleotide transporter BT1, chloroplastic/mitochondrial isoform X3 [Hevea brasiliensis]XP_058002066.1 adenine nucleotide transporter BT1, chloroplastic/mitochondrial isoform X3 [Hevea brasiliensis]XP_058002067.1 adenine nucleotide transporter BT1, chloroplastic/mitochondrial isoform X3 [Hevea brasiliensis]XP_058002068.1 adenine nucleotide transporter BT1, chloroplastic/mitoch
MGKQAIQDFYNKNDGFFSISDMGSQWRFQDGQYLPGGGMFASVNQMGMGFPNSSDNSSIKSLYADLCVKYLSFVSVQEEEGTFKKKKGGLKLKLKVKNPMLISERIAGAVSRIAVAPLETIRTHLMVGSSRHTTTEVFHNIMKTDGWKGLFRGNFVNVIRVAPSKTIEVLIVSLFTASSLVWLSVHTGWLINGTELILFL